MLEFEPWLATMPLKHGTKTARLMCQVPIKYQPSVAFYPIFSFVNIQIMVHLCTKLMRKILYLIFRAEILTNMTRFRHQKSEWYQKLPNSSLISFYLQGSHPPTIDYENSTKSIIIHCLISLLFVRPQFDVIAVDTNAIELQSYNYFYWPIVYEKK